MKKLLLTLAMTALLFTGCATTGGNVTPQDLTPAIKTAALVGTTLVLKDHPEWRGYFVSAAGELAILEQAEKIDFAIILAIFYRLPVKELQSDEAKLAVAGATILLSGYGGKIVELDKLENVRPLAKALREGIELALI